MDEEEIKGRVIFGTGYGKPPQQSQFKKGQSGNPAGRPKATADGFTLTDQRTLRMILSVADRTVQVRENGELRSMSMGEAAVNSIFAKAIKGDPRALTTLLALLQKGDAERALHIRQENAFWQDYKTVQSAKIHEAKIRGGPTPTMLPHPDDVIIDQRKGPRFIGPVSEQGQANLDQALRLRDVLILQDALDKKSTRRLNGEPLTDPGSAYFVAVLLQEFMPPRLRLSTSEWVWRMMKVEIIPKRALLKLLHEEWRKLGSPRPRGYVFPNMGWMQSRLEQVIAMSREIGKLPHPDEMPRGEWERAVASIIEVHYEK